MKAQMQQRMSTMAMLAMTARVDHKHNNELSTPAPLEDNASELEQLKRQVQITNSTARTSERFNLLPSVTRFCLSTALLSFGIGSFFVSHHSPISCCASISCSVASFFVPHHSSISCGVASFIVSRHSPPHSFDAAGRFFFTTSFGRGQNDTRNHRPQAPGGEFRFSIAFSASSRTFFFFLSSSSSSSSSSYLPASVVGADTVARGRVADGVDSGTHAHSSPSNLAAFLFVHITNISSKFVEQENLSSRGLSLRTPTHGLLLWSPLGSRSAHESPLMQPTL